MQKPRQQLYRRLLGASCATFAVFLLSFALVPTLISEVSAAENVSAGVNWTAVSLTLDPDYGNGSVSAEGHGDVVFDSIVPSTASDGNLGTMRVTKKTIGVETTGRYYTVYLSTDSSSNGLDLVGDTDTSIDSISATWSGTGTSAPKAFTEAGWGFAVPNSPLASANTFSDRSVYSAYDSLAGVNMTHASHPSIYNTGKWAAVPALTSPQQIWKATTANVNGFGGEHGDSNNHFDVYYATIIDTDFVAGSYENHLVYTAFANSSAIDTITNNISRSLEYGAAGDIETLSFDLAQSMPTITKDKVEVYLIPHIVTNSNGYVATGLDSYKTNAYKCTIGSAVSDFVITDNKASLNCTIPNNPDGKTAGGTNMEGEYDFLITIPSYGYNYVSKYKTNTDSEVASFIYAGLQTKKRNGTDYIITEMQQMSSSICKNTNRWNNRTGELARILNPYNSTQLVADSATAVATLRANAALGVGTFALTDNRDGKDYLVRRQASGDCWMVQNLDLDLASVGVLTENNSNVTKSWDPYASTNAKIEQYSDKLAELGLSSDFAGLSTLVLGNRDPKQYAPYVGDRFWYTSYRSDDGNFTPISSTINSNTMIPRSATLSSPADPRVRYVATSGLDGSTNLELATTDTYSPTTFDTTNNTFFGSEYVGQYYNNYAATAESVTRSLVTEDGKAIDSICPKGWAIPSDNKFHTLINATEIPSGGSPTDNGGNNYGVDTESTQAIRSIPLSIALTRFIDPIGEFNTARKGWVYYWRAGINGLEPNNTAQNFYTSNTGRIQSYGGDVKTLALAIRCVASN